MIICQAYVRGYFARKLYRRKEELLRAVKIIQRNARIYVGVRDWPWWRLYGSIKPLLKVTAPVAESKPGYGEKAIVICQAYVRGYLARKRYHIKQEQLKAIKIIQKNARIYANVREWPWWTLYGSMKPILKAKALCKGEVLIVPTKSVAQKVKEAVVSPIVHVHIVLHNSLKVSNETPITGTPRVSVAKVLASNENFDKEVGKAAVSPLPHSVL